MIISCPKCETRFVVAPQAIGKDGRTVKCSRCSKTWFQDPPDEALEIVPVKVIKTDKKTTPNPSDGNSPSQSSGEKIKSNVPAVVKKKSFNGQIRWGIAVAVLIGIMASLYNFRPQLEDRFALAREYYQKWDGFVAEQAKEEQARNVPETITEPIAEPVAAPPHPSTFLTMTNSISTNFLDGIPTLSIVGEIRNNGDALISLPSINVDIKNAVGDIVFNTIFNLEQADVAAQGVRSFSISVPNYPTDSSLVDLSLMWDDAP